MEVHVVMIGFGLGDGFGTKASIGRIGELLDYLRPLADGDPTLKRVPAASFPYSVMSCKFVVFLLYMLYL